MFTLEFLLIQTETDVSKPALPVLYNMPEHSSHTFILNHPFRGECKCHIPILKVVYMLTCHL